MQRTDNYLIQAQKAKQWFLRYDQEALIRKLGLKWDSEYLYVNFLCKPYRIHRQTGDISRLEGELWQNANTHAEVMTLLDLVCDSREDRYLSCRWQNMLAFGHMFHRDLLESRDPWAEKIQADVPGLCRACLALGGKTIPGGDVAYAIELFDGLAIGLQFWEGDEEFPPHVCWLWDENAGMYLKYETMHFAVGLLRRRLDEEMAKRE